MELWENEVPLKRATNDLYDLLGVRAAEYAILVVTVTAAILAGCSGSASKIKQCMNNCQHNGTHLIKLKEHVHLRTKKNDNISLCIKICKKSIQLTSVKIVDSGCLKSLSSIYAMWTLAKTIRTTYFWALPISQSSIAVWSAFIHKKWQNISQSSRLCSISTCVISIPI